jgi:hypothetical protein
MQSAIDLRSSPGNSEKLPATNSLRMTEKIAALRTHLPEIVTRNAKAYGILSLGLHELSEEQCAKAYPVLEGVKRG